MTVIQTLLGPTMLPTSLELPSLSILSYNVLLPNSIDGWWNYKMYQPPCKHNIDQISTWEYRQQLLKERIAQIDADIVCLQEVSPLSFEQDFAFMKELGYTGMELYKKGRFRPATFWKEITTTTTTTTLQQKERGLELIVPAVHKDRTLLTAFRHQEHIWYILNCHLQAGSEARRRMRQIHEGTKAVITLARKLKEPEPEKNVKLIVCGDFNGGEECAAIRFLEDGCIEESFLEDGQPVVSSRKELPFSDPLQDVYVNHSSSSSSSVLQSSSSSSSLLPPPTLVVSELIPSMVEDGAAYENPKFTNDILHRLERIFRRYAQHTINEEPVMNVQDVEQWLLTINGKVGRGSEFREAAKQMGWNENKKNDDDDDNNNTAEQSTEDNQNSSSSEENNPITLPKDGYLTLDGFIQVYENELRAGKFWGIAYDLAVLQEPLPDAGLFTGRYDRIYCSSSIQPTAVMHFTSDKPCPNEYEPSDHLPVAATFVVRSQERKQIEMN